MRRNQRGVAKYQTVSGFVFLPVLIIIVLVGAMGYFAWQNYQLKQSDFAVSDLAPTASFDREQLPTPSEIPEQVVQEKIVYVDPDGLFSVEYFGSKWNQDGPNAVLYNDNSASHPQEITTFTHKESPEYQVTILTADMSKKLDWDLSSCTETGFVYTDISKYKKLFLADGSEVYRELIEKNLVDEIYGYPGSTVRPITIDKIMKQSLWRQFYYCLDNHAITIGYELPDNELSRSGATEPTYKNDTSLTNNPTIIAQMDEVVSGFKFLVPYK